VQPIATASVGRGTRSVPCSPPGGEPVAPDPTPIPTPAGSIEIPAGQLTANSVLPADQLLGGGYVVSASTGAYFFPQNSVLTQSNNQMIVRAYGALWTFPGSATVRQLSSTSTVPTASLAAETSADVVNIASSPTRTTIPAADICADCSHAVLREIEQVGLDTEPSYDASQNPAPSTDTTCNTASSSPCGPYANDALDPTTLTAYSQSANNNYACPVGGYVYSDASGACIPSQTPGLQLASGQRSPSSAHRRPHWFSGGVGNAKVRDYVWSFWGQWTSMVMDDPRPNSLLDYDTYYVDAFGGFAMSHGVLSFGNSQRITMTTRRTRTWASLSMCWFSIYPNGLFLSESWAKYARLTW
jgi:hypothetical protein